MTSTNNRRLLPPSLRYLNARLKPFMRPMFWGSATVLALLTFGVWQYSNHPEWLQGTLDGISLPGNNLTTNQDNQVAESGLSKEELAAGANIDSLPVMLSEINQGNPSATSAQAQQQAANKAGNTTPSNPLVNSQNPQQTSSNPVSLPGLPQELLNIGGIGNLLGNGNTQNPKDSSSSSNNTASPTTEGSSFTDRNQNRRQENPLEKELTQLTPNKLDSTIGLNPTQNNLSTNNLPNQSQPATDPSQQSTDFSSYPQAASSYNLPPTTPNTSLNYNAAYPPAASPYSNLPATTPNTALSYNAAYPQTASPYSNLPATTPSPFPSANSTLTQPQPFNGVQAATPNNSFGQVVPPQGSYHSRWGSNPGFSDNFGNPGFPRN